MSTPAAAVADDASFADVLVAAVTVAAQPQIAEVLQRGLGRARSADRPPGAIDGRRVPTGGTVATLILAGLRNESLAELERALRDPAVRRRRDSLRVLVNKALDGDARAFKADWFDALAVSCALAPNVLQLLHTAHRRPGELDPARLERTARTLTPTTAATDGDADLRAWLQAVIDTMRAAPPWCPDAPADVVRVLDRPLAEPVGLLLGGSGAGKTRFLAASVAAAAEAALAAQGPLPLAATASAVVAQVNAAAARGGEADPWDMLVRAATQCAVGRLSAARLAVLRTSLLDRVHAGAPVAVTIDAPDELTESDRRGFVSGNGLISSWLSRADTKIVVASRDDANAPLHLLQHGAQPSRLLPISAEQREEYWRRWHSDTATQLADLSRRDPMLDRLLTSPFLAALAVHTPGTASTRAILIRDAVPHLLSTTWRDTPAAENTAVAVTVELAEAIAWAMATGGAAEHHEWATHCPASRIQRLVRDSSPGRGARRHRNARSALARLVPLLPGLTGPPGTDVAFAHSQLQELLVAQHLFRTHPDPIGFLAARWWHRPEWRAVTVLAAGIADNPAVLLRALDDDGGTEPTGLIDRLAVRALAEVPPSRRPSIAALERVRAQLASPDGRVQSLSAQALEALGPDGFAKVRWTDLAPLGRRNGIEGHYPAEAFTIALRADAPVATIVLERMADGTTPFVVRRLAIGPLGDFIPARNRPLAAQPDLLVQALAAVPHGWNAARLAPADFELHKHASTEVCRRGLTLPSDAITPDFEQLADEGHVEPAVPALARLAADSNRERWSSPEYRLSRVATKLSRQALLDIAADTEHPMLLREITAAELSRRDRAAARPLLTALLPHAGNPLRVALALANLGDRSAPVRRILQDKAFTDTDAARALLAIDRKSALAAYEGLFHAAKRYQNAENRCYHDVMLELGLTLQKSHSGLWLDAVLAWTDCPDSGSDGRKLVDSIRAADRAARRRIATDASAKIRALAIDTLDPVADHDLLVEIAQSATHAVQVAALTALGDAPAALRIITGLVEEHLRRCRGHSGLCHTDRALTYHFPQEIIALPMFRRLPPATARAWHEHLRDLVRAAGHGDLEALGTLRKQRADARDTMILNGADNHFRQALTALARTGVEEALEEIEVEARQDCADPTGRIHGLLLSKGGRWVRELALLAPNRAQALLQAATDAGPVPEWITAMLADLGDPTAADRMLDHSLQKAGTKPALQPTAFADWDVLRVTSSYWLVGTHPERARAAAVNALSAAASKMADDTNCHHLIAAFAMEIDRNGHQLTIEEAAELREILRPSAAELRARLTSGRDAASQPQV